MQPGWWGLVEIEQSTDGVFSFLQPQRNILSRELPRANNVLTIYAWGGRHPGQIILQFLDLEKREMVAECDGEKTRLQISHSSVAVPTLALKCVVASGPVEPE